MLVAVEATAFAADDMDNDDDVVGQATLSVGLDPKFHGIELGGAGGFHGVIFGIDLFGVSLTSSNDGSSYFAGGADISLKVSVLGLLVHDHRIEHWIDFGGDFGAGGGFTPGFTQTLTFGRAWYGGFLEIGLAPGDAYPALVLGVRQIASSAPWGTDTVFSVGIGWVGRSETLDLGMNHH